MESLKRRYSIHLQAVRQNDEPGDVVCQAASGELIKIQVVEALDLLCRQLQERRDTYAQALADPSSGVLSLFNGCELTLTDQGTRPTLPPLKRTSGAVVFEEIRSRLQGFAQELRTLETGRIYVRKWTVGQQKVKVSVLCKYHAPVCSDVSGSLRWGGGRVFDDLHEEEGFFIRKAVRRKLAKYAKPQEEFWLLVYGADLPPFSIEDDQRATRHLLDNAEHPFDKVWFLYPVIGSRGSDVRLVWEAGTREQA